MRVLLCLLVALASAVGRTRAATPAGWEDAFRQRLNWWSLRPVQSPSVPTVQDERWPRTSVDRFVLHNLEAHGLHPAPEADRRILARRLSLALTGLPPDVAAAEAFATDGSPEAERRYLEGLLASPHFGEHWARHWLDVVHYSDTHGYEWDTPAKNAWRYRDYVVRAFNQDLSIRRFLLEQLAGDLVEPRLDPATGLNEALIAPMALRLGERRHGDNADAEGVSQEAIANVIDTVGKGFLATTVACAQCHDHKLDAVAQNDFYAWAGVLMSTRWISRSAETRDPNTAVLDDLRRLKAEIRAEVARRWFAARDGLEAQIRRWPTAPAKGGFPDSLAALWSRSQTNAVTPAEFAHERARRQEANRTNLTWIADFTRPEPVPGWQWDGWGMQHGWVRDGELVVAEEGTNSVQHLLPAGRWSHVWSSRMAGALRGPLLESGRAYQLTTGHAGGRHAASSLIVDQCFHSERMRFLQQPFPGWLTWRAGEFGTLEGGVDRTPRRVYLEFVTKSLNNYFPPRTGYGGVKESDLLDERSWFGVTRVAQHAVDRPPLDELTRFEPLFRWEGDWAGRLARLVNASVERWGRDQADAEDVALLNDAIAAGLLPIDLPADSALARPVNQYRATAARLQADRTVGSVAEWTEGRDERLGLRGSYTELGEAVPRGNIRFLGGAVTRTEPRSSGRLEVAQRIADDANPLTARVFVNRVWLHLFGEGLVRTPDDFGHLGETPAHPELLDYLTTRFIAEGWSLKRLITLLVSSAVWRQDSRPSVAALNADPENRWWHYRPMRRLEAESIRDAMLAVSGRLDPTLEGPPLDPYRTAEDAAKRLFRGPLDGAGRRSLYTKVTLMEPPRFLALFNQPIPKLTTGRRDVTSVPDQALALLNDPFVIETARFWGERVVQESSPSAEARVQQMFTRAFGRPPRPEETSRLVELARQSARLRGADPTALLACAPVWQDVAHALFNLKEFIHVP